jgi:uncharacterized membrane protein (DUF2068 family)
MKLSHLRYMFCVEIKTLLPVKNILSLKKSLSLLLISAVKINLVVVVVVVDQLMNNQSNSFIKRSLGRFHKEA